jgi:hypothetical protein
MPTQKINLNTGNCSTCGMDPIGCRCEIPGVNTPEARSSFAHASIAKARRVLLRTERGRDVMAELLPFCRGRVSALDGPGWDAVLALLQAYCDGFPGSVLEALEPVREVGLEESPVLAVVPLDDVIAIKQALDLDNWTEQTGYGSTEGAKCPHCALIVKPAELPAHPGEMACPACTRPFKWTVIHIAGMHTYNTLTLRPDLAAGQKGGA